MQPRYRWIALVVSLLSLLLALAACRREDTAIPAPAPISTMAPVQPTPPPAPSVQASAPTQTSAPAQAAAATQARAPVAPKAPAAVGTPSQSLRLNIGLLGSVTGSEPDTIDPQKAIAIGENTVALMVFENLMAFDVNGKLVPAAAADMPQVSSDGLVYTFKLRDGLKYSDGQPLRAKDFEYGWKRHLDPQTASHAANYGYIIKGGEVYNTADPTKLSQAELQQLRDAVGVKALDDRTLQFTLEKPAGYFLSILTTWNGLPTRQDMVEKGGEKWTEPATYIGNGPFILKEWQHAVKMVFEPNPNYRQGPPPLKRIEFAMIADPSVAFTAYLNHELDATDVSTGQLTAVQNPPDLKQQWTREAGAGSVWLNFILTKKPFDDVRVRQAFAYAIDRETLVKDVMQGLGLPAYQPIPPGLPGHYDDLRTPKFDPAMAKKLLAEAGYPDGKGLPEITFSYDAGPFIPKGVPEFIQAQLKTNLGVNIKLEPIETQAYIAAWKNADTAFQMYQGGWLQDYPDPQDWYSLLWHSTQLMEPTGWKNAQFDRLTEQADSEPNPAKRDALYKQAAQIVLDEGPMATLYHIPRSFVIKPWVQGCQYTAFDWFPCQATIMQVRIAPH